MKRRDFFVRAGAIAGVVLLAPRRLLAADPMPVLYGDGIHDDADALQALLDGRDVWDAGLGRVHRGKGAQLAAGNFKLSKTLTVNGPAQKGNNIIITGCTFRGGGSEGIFRSVPWR